MGPLGEVALFAVYISVVFLLSFWYKNRPKSDKKIVDEFYEYTKKGPKRVPHLSDTLPVLAFLQLLYPPVAVSMFVAWSVPAYLSFIFWLIISLFIFYLFALWRDPMKRHRHNGIPIGTEYPHPVSIRSNPMGDRAFGRAVTAGSKGTYDLPIKSEPNPHVMVIGESGSGKSTLIEALLVRAYLRLGIPFLIIDWSGAYADLGVNTWEVPRSLRINPFSLRGMGPERRAGVASELLQMGLSLTEMQTQRVRETLADFLREEGDPTIRQVHDALLESARFERYRETRLQLTYVTSKLRQAFGIFGTEPAAFWDGYGRTCSVIELRGLTDAEKRLATHTIMQRITEEFGTERGTRLHIALDDAYQALLGNYGRETNITRVVREGRKYGFGLVIATQLLQDLPDAVIGNTALKVAFSYHEPGTLQRLQSMMRLSDLEKSVMHRMPVGACLLFDQRAIQEGKAHPAYVRTEPLSEGELGALREGIKRVSIVEINNAENAQIGAETVARRLPALGNVFEEIDIPPVSVCRFLFALNREGSEKGAIRYVKERRWLTSLATLYGGKGKPSIMERAQDAGYVEDGKLSARGRRAMVPTNMIQTQGMNKGAEIHVALMKKTIGTVQERGNFAFVPRANDSFDVGELCPTRDRKGLWDYRKVTAYEVQTTAIRSEIERCIARSKQLGTTLVFVTNSHKVGKEIAAITEGRYKVLILKPYEGNEPEKD
jgi:hypothetical protein